eukprot:GEZU01022707.1.p1 GENE.GEZU01022707.1~~GEZU01022707.1.p1  ORF type:complete len:618 (-),score=165.86 GEZU01022707.1:79-1932(-)
MRSNIWLSRRMTRTREFTLPFVPMRSLQSLPRRSWRPNTQLPCGDQSTAITWSKRDNVPLLSFTLLPQPVGTPGQPYGGKLSHLCLVEDNMKERRKMVAAHLKPDEVLMSISMFPLMGSEKVFTYPAAEPNGPIAQSLYLPDEIINPHPRFGTLTANIRKRRGNKVCILSPLYMDKNTDPEIGCSSNCTCDGTNSNNNQTTEAAPVYTNPLFTAASPTQYFLPQYFQKKNGANKSRPPAIYMDAMGFGMGCCCLQCTFQASDINEARELYDQLAVICPIMLAITAATPILKGLLADTDVRWNVISSSVDDRKPEEKQTIQKSRYDSISTFIANKPEALRYSDLDLKQDPEAYDTLRKAGIDHILARHVAHLFIRDPLVIFKERINLDDENESDHFENIQSTNWQTMRFKPPPPNSPIGWRVEFRVMECQMTDFENAAFIVFIVLLTRAILSFGLNFYIPISKVDENMARAHMRDAVLTKKFYFRKNITKSSTVANGSSIDAADGSSIDDEYTEMSINEIINGEGDFVGLVPLVQQYLDSMTVDVETRNRLQSYLRLVSMRASGECQTTAKFMRDFVLDHPKYAKDSRVTPDIAYDLLETVNQIATGKLRPEALFGPQ